MQTADAFEMGLRSARAGLFFDTMELVAALSVSAGGFDRLEDFVRTLSGLQGEVAEELPWVIELLSGAFKQRYAMPQSVDAYRQMLREGVFEIVNRWSYIKDIKQVTQLQAWFYAGFGLGRAHTVLRGAEQLTELRDRLGVLSPLDQMPDNLSRMASESARQCVTVSEEHDFWRIRPLFQEVGALLDSYALQLQASAEAYALPSTYAQDLERVAELTRQCRLEYARSATA